MRVASPAPPPRPWVIVSGAAITPGTQHRGTETGWVLGYVRAGACEHGPPQGPRLQVGDGDVVGIAPRTPQWWRVLGDRPWQVISCIFQPRPHWLPWLAWRETAPGFAIVHPPSTQRRSLGRQFEAALRWSSSGRADALDHAAHALEGVILACAAWWRPVPLGDERIQRVIDALAQDLAKPMQLAQLARWSGISRAQLLRRFRRVVGCSPIAYQSRLRLQRARALLQHSPLSVKEIAACVGFRDPGYFCRWFRLQEGSPPRRWRLALPSDGAPLP